MKKEASPAPAAAGHLTSDSERKCFSGLCLEAPDPELSEPVPGWKLFIVPKSYYCVFNGSLYIVSASAPPLAILEPIYTM